METQQQQNHHPNTQNIAISDHDQHIQDHDQAANNGVHVGGMNSNNKSMMSSGNGYVCSSTSRQSSTRWTPTTDQIRILKDLYYNNGIRSPTADQIQRISSRLRQYGKIEGKNVFYWFQNHKARERQKKRFTHDHHLIIPPPPPPMNINFSPLQTPPLPPPHPSSHHIYNNHHHKQHLYPSYLSPAGVPCSSTSCTSPAGVLGTVGQINGSCGNYGSVAMEKSFRDCSISQGETQNCGWVGVDHPYTSTYHSFLDKRNPFEHNDQETLDDDHDQDEDYDQESPPEIETLPLFPMHGDYNTSNGFFKSDHSSSGTYGYYNGSWYRSDDYAAANNAGSRASLELSLNSYTGWSMDLHN